MKLIAVPTLDHSGWHGKLVDFLSRAEIITMVTIDNGESDVIETLINPFFSDIQGFGQLIVQYLHARLCALDNYVFSSHLVRLL